MSYKLSGVDTSAADSWVERIQKQLGGQELLSGVGDYAAVYRMDSNELLATSCDGIGSKILWGLEKLGQPKNLAQDLIAMNVNDVLCTGATPKLFLDYLACSGREALRPGSFLNVFMNGLIETCRENSQILAGGETAQMPDLYKGDHFDAAGFSIGFMKAEDYLHPSRLKAGLPVYGWPSSGPHSNGYTWLRKLFDSKSDAAFISSHLMKGTTIYSSSFLRLRENLRAAKTQIQSAYHITGSGLLNLLRSQSKVGFLLDSWPETLPEWLTETQKRSQATWSELFSTFNCGIGFVFVSDKDIAPETLKDFGLLKLGKTIPTPNLHLPQYGLILE